MYRVLIAPDFEISPANPDFPPAFLDLLKTARDVTGSNYVSFWALFGEGPLKSNIVVSTYPASWLTEYSAKDYSKVDPTLIKVFGGAGAYVFDHENPKEDEPAALARDALAAGIGRYTIGIPTQVGKSISSATTFGTDIDVTGDTDEVSATLVACREQAHILTLAVVDRFHRSEAPKPNLSGREREVLYWGSRGKSDAEAGTIMGLSRWTVVAHVQSAKAKLGVKNKAAAVARALELGMFKDFENKL